VEILTDLKTPLWLGNSQCPPSTLRVEILTDLKTLLRLGSSTLRVPTLTDLKTVLRLGNNSTLRVPIPTSLKTFLCLGNRQQDPSSTLRVGCSKMDKLATHHLPRR
jgi:hypothetical protein